MREYLALLLIISLVLLAFFQVAKKSIPLNARVIYGTVGISFTLGAFFPMTIANLTWGKALGVYGVIIAIAAAALSCLERRAAPVHTTPVKIADLESEEEAHPDITWAIPDGLPVQDGTQELGRPDTDSATAETQPALEADAAAERPVAAEPLETAGPAADGAATEVRPVFDGEATAAQVAAALDETPAGNLPEPVEALPETPATDADAISEIELPPAEAADWTALEAGIAIDELPPPDDELEAAIDTEPAADGAATEARPLFDGEATALQAAAALDETPAGNLPEHTEAPPETPDTDADALSEIELPPAEAADWTALEDGIAIDELLAPDDELEAAIDTEPAADWTAPAAILPPDALPATNGATVETQPALEADVAAEQTIAAEPLEIAGPAADGAATEARPVFDGEVTAAQVAAAIDETPAGNLPEPAEALPETPDTDADAISEIDLPPAEAADWTALEDVIAIDELPAPDDELEAAIDTEPAADWTAPAAVLPPDALPATDSAATEARPVFDGEVTAAQVAVAIDETPTGNLPEPAEALPETPDTDADAISEIELPPAEAADWTALEDVIAIDVLPVPDDELEAAIDTEPAATEARPVFDGEATAAQVAAALDETPAGNLPEPAEASPETPATDADALSEIELPPAEAADWTAPEDVIAIDELPPPDGELEAAIDTEPAADWTAPAAVLPPDAPPATDSATAADRPAVQPESPAGDYVLAGFQAKARGDLDAALNFFFKAFQLNQEQQVSTALAMEISVIYQEQGQYPQARMMLHSVLRRTDLDLEQDLKQALESRLVYLHTLEELLRSTKMPGTPHSQIPDYIKREARIKSLQN